MKEKKLNCFVMHNGCGWSGNASKAELRDAPTIGKNYKHLHCPMCGNHLTLIKVSNNG